MKTLTGWALSGVELNQYLKPGDRVDVSIEEYFVSELPPETWNKNTIQMGEPWSMNELGYVYHTLENINGVWVYVGVKNKQKEVKNV